MLKLLKKPLDGAILPFVKFSGITSFGALNQIKKALNTRKVGHTGTLDSFADGLLVAVVGRYTKLASYITGCDKEYLAVFKFGEETDTLDPSGVVIKRGKLPNYQALMDIVPNFVGKQSQIPPNYSAVHFNGRRSSDLMRSGEKVELQAREIEIFSIDVLEVNTTENQDIAKNPFVEEVMLKISCSKGTYIRALARDMALACGSFAFVSKLRRTRVGNFNLADAVGARMLPEFSVDNYVDVDTGIESNEIIAGCVSFSESIAKTVGLKTLELKSDFYDRFVNGRFIKKYWFKGFKPSGCQTTFAVFCCNEFCGIVNGTDGGFEYGAVFADKKR
ncbi:MAG: tRNA pseudouridine(55) synthase TruB [Treponema sp.]|nr:MAG: tRNA pseudouridine(55) synthase TruB [Treponema sp.]